MPDITGGAGPNTGLRSGAGGAPPLGPGAVYLAGTSGPVSLTGTTAEANLAAIKIPANTVGKNGVVEISAQWSYTNSSNNKTLTNRFTQAAGATAGGAMGTSLVATTTGEAQTMTVLRNNNAANVQAAHFASPVAPFGTSTNPVALAVDTTQDSYININGQLALGTETITLMHAYAVVYPRP